MEGWKRERASDIEHAWAYQCSTSHHHVPCSSCDAQDNRTCVCAKWEWLKCLTQPALDAMLVQTRAGVQLGDKWCAACYSYGKLNFCGYCGTPFSE